MSFSSNVHFIAVNGACGRTVRVEFIVLRLVCAVGVCLAGSFVGGGLHSR